MPNECVCVCVSGIHFCGLWKAHHQHSFNLTESPLIYLSLYQVPFSTVTLYSEVITSEGSAYVWMYLWAMVLLKPHGAWSESVCVFIFFSLAFSFLSDWKDAPSFMWALHINLMVALQTGVHKVGGCQHVCLYVCKLFESFLRTIQRFSVYVYYGWGYSDRQESVCATPFNSVIQFPTLVEIFSELKKEWEEWIGIWRKK